MQLKRISRIQLSYLPVFFVICFSLLFIAYLTLSEMSKQSAYKTNDVLAHNMVQMIDESLHTIDSAVALLVQDNTIVKRFFHNEYTEDKQYWDYRAASVLNEIIAGHPLIDSIYLYRTSDNHVLTPTTFVKLDEFGDRQFVGSKLSSLQPFRWSNARIYQEQLNGPGTQVVSLAKYANLSDRSLIVVNIRTEELSGMLRDMTPSGLNYIELANASGELIASREWPVEEGRLREASAPSKEWSKAESSYTGWSVRSGVYEGSVMQWISSLFYIWIGLGALVIVLGVIWLVYVTRRNYLPIQTISQRMNDYFRHKQQELKLPHQGDELKYIESAMEELLDQSSALQEQNEENLVYRKRHIFLQMMEGGGRQHSDVREELEAFGYSADKGTPLIAVIEIDGYTAFSGQYSQRDQYLLKHVLKSALSEMAADEAVVMWAEWMDRRQLGVLFLLGEGGEEKGVAVLEKLVAWAGQHLPYSVTAGMGTVQSSFGGIGESYESAVDALHYKTSLGTGRVIRHTDHADKMPFETLLHARQIRAISQAYRAGDAAWEQHWHELFEGLHTQLFSREELLGLLNYLLYQLHREVAELPEEFQSIWNSGAHAELHDVFGQQETTEAISGACYQILKRVFEQMSELRESKNNHGLIHRVKQYILEHYHNPDLSHAHLEGEFGMTPSYLSRLFKEQFGVKFNAYVTQTRMEKAIELLKRHPDKTVQEIAEQVGYLHGITFIRAFKKYTGCTPGNFRKDMHG
ncbi:helix-turn-helix domain-containing protein [Paenibacillus sp. J5C_2022]|uniref:helix-turn-helix domain-containing protein n=1 Tax=Paenibacillus sp. J5C2022 TaxID=2977129 RepID=UPI0021CE0551|nr:helix-turn-helix domain-containing protein [Paenibacillus sp. J5C2022]MCU6710558.1 helix-turn-helix domain-containing protein [Paenibacillus sp. J5C2022]